MNDQKSEITTTEFREQCNPTTFLEIAGISHDENSWSDIYAHFLNHKDLGPMFLNSLLFLIRSKTDKKISVDEFRVRREVVTANDNRIDLLITSRSHSIIIENKVRHILNNDLEDYWLSAKGNDSEKTGVVLSLTHILTHHPDFVNITHREWISEVKKQLKEREISLTPHEEFLFNDFCQCIMKESNCHNIETAKCYLKDRERINAYVDAASAAKERLMHMFTDQKFIRSLNDFTLVHDDRTNSRYRYVMYKLPGTNELVITILYEFLWNSAPGDARILFLIEPLGEWFKIAEKMEKDIVRIVKEEGIGYNYAHTRHFWHCGGVECQVDEEHILDEEYIKGCIVDQLLNPESKLMKAARRIAKEIYKIHIPSYSWTEAFNHLQQSQAKRGGEDFANRTLSGLRFVLYDRRNQLVVLEALDKETKTRMEVFAYDDIMEALKQAFGKEVRFSIICQ